MRAATLGRRKARLVQIMAGFVVICRSRRAPEQHGWERRRQRADPRAPFTAGEPRRSTGPAILPPAPIPGAVARLSSDGRTAIPPAGAPLAVQQAIYAANRITRKPYRYGGGHRSFRDRAYDCSGSVSFALHGGGLLLSPLDSRAFMRWGVPGPGQWITVYTNPGHAYVVIAGLRFDTSGPGKRGPRWRVGARSSRSFQARHPWALSPAAVCADRPYFASALTRSGVADGAPKYRRLEPPERRRRDHDLVPGLQPHVRLPGAADSRRRSGRDDVARLERHQPARGERRALGRRRRGRRSWPTASSRR